MPKIITICGSSRFIDIMAVCSWLLEKEEYAIVMGLHLLPRWYPNCPDDHLAEHEKVAEQMDELHLWKIDLSDEIFIVDVNGYCGESTVREIRYAVSKHKNIRYFSSDPLGRRVEEMRLA